MTDTQFEQTISISEHSRTESFAARDTLLPVEQQSDTSNEYFDAPHPIAAHLSKKATTWLQESDERRIARVMSDIEILYPTLEGLINEVEWLINEPLRMRARGLVICGNPGSGKTALARRIQRTYPVDQTNGPRPRVLSIQMSGARRTKAVLNRILTATQAPISRSITIGDQELLVVETLRRMNCRLLILDEMQDILQAPPSEQTRVLEIIKYLMNTLSLPILALGPDQAGMAFRADPHLQKRFQILPLPDWKEGDELGAFLHALEQHLPLRHPSNLNQDAIQKVLMKLTGGNLDEILMRIRVAAVSAITSGEERITLNAIGAPIARPSIEVLWPKS